MASDVTIPSVRQKTNGPSHVEVPFRLSLFKREMAMSCQQKSILFYHKDPGFTPQQWKKKVRIMVIEIGNLCE